MWMSRLQRKFVSLFPFQYSLIERWTVWNGQTTCTIKEVMDQKRSTKGSHLNHCRCTTAPPSFPLRSLSRKRKSFRSHATALRAMAETEQWLKKGAELFRFFWVIIPFCVHFRLVVVFWWWLVVMWCVALYRLKYLDSWQWLLRSSRSNWKPGPGGEYSWSGLGSIMLHLCPLVSSIHMNHKLEAVNGTTV